VGRNAAAYQKKLNGKKWVLNQQSSSGGREKEKLKDGGEEEAGVSSRIEKQGIHTVGKQERKLEQ